MKPKKPDFFEEGAACVLFGLVLCLCLLRAANAADSCDRYVRTVIREAQAVGGLNAPIPMYLGQMRQESSCREGITASDGGMGLLQFMPATAAEVSHIYAEIGPPDPYNPTWAIRAQVRYTGWLEARVKGRNVCQKRGAALKAYNSGLGWVQQAQKASPDPLTWFGVTEFVPTKQSKENFEYSRTYPRKILLKHQLLYKGLGTTTCLPEPS